MKKEKLSLKAESWCNRKIKNRYKLNDSIIRYICKKAV